MLLWQARAAGLDVRAEGETLVVRGPQDAAVLAGALLARKANVLAALSPACWWDREPWCGQIDTDTFLAVVDAYRARFGHYSPALPLRHPELLAELGFDVPLSPPAPRLPCHGCGGELPADRWLYCVTCRPVVAAKGDRR